tara:strand:+ start:79 stop:819 length:741 start_codon:yes stop_codon:yes gene_type:complete
MIVIVGIVLALIIIGVLVYFLMNKGDDSSSDDSSSEDSSPKGEELIITDEGSEIINESKKEGYIQMPNLSMCAMERGEKPNYCSNYEFSETTGFVYTYDLSLADIGSPTYEECVGGGHDCWYTEQYDQDGTLVGVVDKDGVSLLDKIADDVWGDKWSEDAGIVKFFKKDVEYKDGKLIAKEEIKFPGKEIKPGEVLKPGDVPATSLYFIALFSSMKLAGAEKPSKITLKIKNTKMKFDKMIEDKKP